MSKNILLAQINRKDMGLSVKKLLDDYFRADEIQNALRDIGQPTSGTKDVLVQRVRNNWESYNRDIYELLDFTDKYSLQQICYHYSLDATDANHDVLKRRIKKANLLGSSGKPKPTAHVNRSHDYVGAEPKTKTEEDSKTSHFHFHISSVTRRHWIIGIAIGIASIVIPVILFMMG